VATELTKKKEKKPWGDPERFWKNEDKQSKGLGDSLTNMDA